MTCFAEEKNARVVFFGRAGLLFFLKAGTEAKKLGLTTTSMPCRYSQTTRNKSQLANRDYADCYSVIIFILPSFPSFSVHPVIRIYEYVGCFLTTHQKTPGRYVNAFIIDIIWISK